MYEWMMCVEARRGEEVGGKNNSEVFPIKGPVGSRGK